MSEIKLINLASYVRPEVVEDRSNDWVLNGRNNSFYQYIIDRNNGSATNNSINQSYATLIYGKGLSTDSGSFGAETFGKLQTILRPRELRKIVTDFQIFGEFSFQVVESKGGELHSIIHLPKQMVAPSIVNEDDLIELYWVSKDWANKGKKENKPTALPSFGNGSGNSIYVGKPYRVGEEYFGSPDYSAGLQYCEAEEEISNMTISSIKNGLSAGYIINIPDGINYTPEEKEEFERQVKKKLTSSSNASNFIIAFNGADVSIEVTPFPVNSSVHKQWEVLTTEAKAQIMTSHRVISPSLVGLDSATGFSSDADMIDKSEKQLIKRVIAPKQQFILDAIEEVLTSYDMNISLTFKPLTQEELPKESNDVELTSNTTECVKCSLSGSNEPSDEFANELIALGEDLNEDFSLMSFNEVDYDTDDDILDLVNFTNTGKAFPNAKSEQDNDKVMVRYRYTGSTPQRGFCKSMMTANKLYRKEDILRMEKSSTNPGFGKGDGGSAPYSIWLWKGGGKMSAAFPNGTCKHKWQREIYLRKEDASKAVLSPNMDSSAKTISTSEARRKGLKVPTNNSDVSITPNKNKS